MMDFYQIVKCIETPHAIQGMQAKGIDGVEKPLDCIEDMASYALDAIPRVAASRPIFPDRILTRRLRHSGDGPAANCPGRKDWPSGHARFLAPHQPTIIHPADPPVDSPDLAASRARRLQWLGVKPPFQTVLDVEPSPILRPFRESAYLALERYQPRFYPGKINFVRAAISTDFPADPAAVWSHLAQEFEVETVPGDHLGIMTTHFEDLAATISRLLKQADSD